MTFLELATEIDRVKGELTASAQNTLGAMGHLAQVKVRHEVELEEATKIVTEAKEAQANVQLTLRRLYTDLSKLMTGDEPTPEPKEPTDLKKLYQDGMKYRKPLGGSYGS